jgi:lipoprotein-anchoring transpeptidase ErfK/SrfK
MTPTSSVIRIFTTVRRALLLLAVLGALGVQPAYAQDGTTTEEPPPPPPVIPEDVTVSGVLVGGLTADEATAALRTFFTRPLTLIFKAHNREVLPGRVGAWVSIRGAVNAALAAAPSATLTLGVNVTAWRLRAFVARISRAWGRPAVNSTVHLRNYRPVITRARQGFRIRRPAARLMIRYALVNHLRDPLALPYRIVRPSITRRNFGPVSVIRRGSRGLYLYRGAEFRRYFGVAVGMPQYPTPLGRFSIVTMQRNPWWYPPDAGWAAGASPIPPGPGNPLGTRWMGLSVGGVGIHGTPDAASIGYSASHGCIRMRIPDAEWLFERVRVGTPVFIVSA